jgi:hypothetical protein
VPDERCQGRGEVALALEVDAVSLHDAVLRHGEKEPVELVETVRHARQPALTNPCCLWAHADLTVCALVVCRDEIADRLIEVCEREMRFR